MNLVLSDGPMDGKMDIFFYPCSIVRALRFWYYSTIMFYLILHYDFSLWSPSRIIKDFLVYRELSTRDRSVKRDEPIDESLQRRVQAEGLKVHQCSKGTFVLRNNGFLKKTISLKFNGTYQHMIIYEDGIGKLDYFEKFNDTILR